MLCTWLARDQTLVLLDLQAHMPLLLSLLLSYTHTVEMLCTWLARDQTLVLLHLQAQQKKKLL